MTVNVPSQDLPIIDPRTGRNNLEWYTALGRIAKSLSSLIDLIAAGYLSSSPTLGIGYITGAGGSVTQITSKSTSVTLNTVCGQIVTHNGSLAGGAITGFVVNNSTIVSTDTIVVNVQNVSVSDTGNYRVYAERCQSGTFIIRLHNITAGALSDAVTISFAVVRAAIS